MRRLHGRDWRTAAATGRGRLPWHLATVAAAGLGAGALAAAAGHRGRSTPLALAGLGAWAGLTARFAALRIAPGPRDRSEVWRMTWTSAAIPFAAVWHRALGWWRHRGAEPWPPPVRAVLFDRDGTLVHDVPYNADPGAVAPVPQAARSVARLRSAGLRVGVVSNQSGVARGLITPEALSAVNAAVEDRVGRFDTWQVCVHGPEDACSCRKPRPGLVQAAARELGVRPQHCVVIGDIGADVLAARAAGARGILVPTDATLPQEVATAPEVAADLETAVDLVLGRGHVG
jgi:histidinol-phosphate phosphatase family protein